MLSDFTGTCLAVFACLHVTCTWMAYIVWMLFLVFGLPLTWSATIFLAYLGWYLYDRETPYQAGCPSAMRDFFLWKYLARWFPAKLHKTADLDPSKNYIFAFHPHGFWAFGGFIHFATNATGFDRLFPGIRTHVLTLDGHFTLPFYRDYLIRAFGFGCVSSRSIDWKLTKLGPGHSALIVIGGSAEMSLFDPNCYTFKLNNRKGFIRKALQTGASLVPVFSFNEHRLYDLCIPEKWSMAYFVQQMVKRFCRLEVPVQLRGWSKWTGHMLPKKVPLNTVCGAPIDFAELKSFQRGQVPSQELVDECHSIYLEALRKLYDDNKARFGDQDTPLIFV